VVFEIQYTATASRPTDATIPICNDISFVVGMTQVGAEEVC